jgi:hypothetical protein
MNDCTRVATVGETRYPCHHHEDRDGEVHVFKADLPDPCTAPYCRLPAGHRTLHDIPSGRATFADAAVVPPAPEGRNQRT